VKIRLTEFLSRHRAAEELATRAGRETRRISEHREVPASVDRDECLCWRLDGIHERAHETRGGGEVFSALNHEDRNSEVAGERDEPTSFRRSLTEPQQYNPTHSK
jgi:hypothetical protein